MDGGVYVSDDWKVRPNSTLSYGLRFETQNYIHDRADWAPRFGIAYGLGRGSNRAPKTVLRAGFGIFYDRFGQQLQLQAQILEWSVIRPSISSIIRVSIRISRRLRS